LSQTPIFFHPEIEIWIKDSRVIPNSPCSRSGENENGIWAEGRETRSATVVALGKLLSIINVCYYGDKSHWGMKRKTRKAPQ